MNNQSTQKHFTFTFYRFERNGRNITTAIVRSQDEADGLRGLVTKNDSEISAATERVHNWAEAKGLSISSKEPHNIFCSITHHIYSFLVVFSSKID